MTAWLRRRGDAVHPTRVRRWLRTMGLEALSATPRRSPPAAGHRIDPYRWRGVTGERRHHVWSADITSSRVQSGLVYLGAVVEWCSRYGLSWAVSLTMDVPFCVAARDQALRHGQPEICNTDHGAPFTSQACTARLQPGGGQISLEGRGRALDHVWVERLWRSVKYAAVYLRDYHSVWEARQGWARYVAFYHEERLQQARGYRTPAAVYLG